MANGDWKMVVQNVGSWYQNCLSSHPVSTQILSSGFLWGIGDIGAQYITHVTSQLQSKREKVKFEINWQRVGITSVFGLGFVGPFGHFWYEGLDKFMRLGLKLQPNSVRFVAAKVAADSVMFGPLTLLAFFTYMGFANGRNVREIKEDVKRDFLPSLVLEGGVWPVLQTINFRFVPVRYQLLYVNIFCLMDSVFLSWVEQQKDAAWKQFLFPAKQH